MEQAILAMLGIIITLMLYLDRGRRADDAQIRRDMNENSAQVREEMRDANAQIRRDMNENSAQVREEMRENNAQIRQEMSENNAQIRQEMNDGFKQVHSRLDKLTDIVMDLCRRMGRLEGRAESKEVPDDSI